VHEWIQEICQTSTVSDAHLQSRVHRKCRWLESVPFRSHSGDHKVCGTYLTR